MIASKKYSLLLFFGLILSFAGVFAQESFMRHFTLQDGLPSNTIYRMEQDNDGYIWIGTEFGASRFNGKVFENFTMANGLSDNEIIHIKKDSKGRIWFLGYNGTVSYWYQNKFYNEQTDTLLKQIKTDQCFLDLFEDRVGKIWFLAASKSVILDNKTILKPSLYNIPTFSFITSGNNRQIVISYRPNNSTIYENNRFRPIDLQFQKKLGCGMVEFGNGNILFTAKEGLILQSDTVQKLILKYPKEIASSRYISLAISKDSLIWIAGQNGLYFCHFNDPNKIEQVYYTNSTCSNMFTDKEENIWMGTLDDGILMLPKLSRNQKLIDKKNGLPDNNCFSICKLANGKILVGMRNNLLAEVDPKNCTGKRISHKNINLEKIDFIVKKGEDIWIIANNQILHKNNETKLEHLVYFNDHDTKRDKTITIKGIGIGKEKLYITTNVTIFEYPIDSISLGYCNKQGRLHPNEMACVAEIKMQKINRNYSAFVDQNQSLWFANANGIFYNKNGINFLYVNKLPYNRINAINYTIDSLLIVGTHGFGIYIYKNGKEILKITRENGLTNNVCRKVKVHSNKIYVATPSGISIITLDGSNLKHILNLNKSNLLPSDVVNDLFLDDKELGVATSNGIILISQQTLKSLEQPKPMLKLFVEKAENGNLKFKFDGIYYLSPEAVNYRYRLKQNQDWNTTTINQLEFAFLEPGEYQFEVQARVDQGKWTYSSIYPFLIYPPFWQKWWFILIVALVFAALIAFLGHKRINHLQLRQAEKQRAKQQLIDLEQQALLTMMNPHFIFNVMNSIQHFINQNNADAANQYLSDFAKLIRMNLSVSVKKYISLEEELNYLNLYLSFEQLRFGNQLNYHILVDPNIDTDETTVAVMLIQPFLENAIWHGILPMQAKGEISLTINKYSEQLLEIIVTDNGVGIANKFLETNFETLIEKSHGLNLSIQRLKLLCEAIELLPTIAFSHLHPSSKNKGTRVRYLLPTK